VKKLATHIIPEGTIALSADMLNGDPMPWCANRQPPARTFGD
jgi:hypothetical protein